MFLQKDVKLFLPLNMAQCSIGMVNWWMEDTPLMLEHNSIVIIPIDYLDTIQIIVSGQKNGNTKIRQEDAF